jgi:hypothetical protein
MLPLSCSLMLLHEKAVFLLAKLICPFPIFVETCIAVSGPTSAGRAGWAALL